MTSSFSFGGYATAEEEDASFLGKMRDAVSRTRDQFGASLDSVLALGRTVDEDTLDDLEAVLLTADLGSSHNAGGDAQSAHACPCAKRQPPPS